MSKKKNTEGTEMDRVISADTETMISPVSQTEAEKPPSKQRPPGKPADTVADKPIIQTDPENPEIEQLGPGDPVEDPAKVPEIQTEIESVDTELPEPGNAASSAADEPVSQTESEMTPDDPEGALSRGDIPDEIQTDNGDAKMPRPSSPVGRRKAPKDSSVSESDTADPDVQPPGEAAHIDTQSGTDEKDSGTSRKKAKSVSGLGTKKRKTARTKEDASDKSQSGLALLGTNSLVQPQKRLKIKKVLDPVVAVDDERMVETKEDRLNSDLIDLAESLKSQKILSGTIQGVESPDIKRSVSYATLYHGEFKVIIPSELFAQLPSDLGKQNPNDVMRSMIIKRLGSETDFIVVGVDPDSGIAVGSRVAAMEARRRKYYFGRDRDGNNILYEGVKAEARVVGVIQPGIFVDLFGLEVYIPLRDLSFQRWFDATLKFRVGERVHVVITSLDKSDRNNIKVRASVKLAMENPYEKALRKYSIGNNYVGTVSLISPAGVFVSMDGGIDCLCQHPKRGRPPRGSLVTVRILGMDQFENRMWGVIIHMTSY